MSLIYRIDVFCDNCGNWIEGGSDRTPHFANRARHVARKQGWSCTRHGGYKYLCPACTTLYRQGKLGEV